MNALSWFIYLASVVGNLSVTLIAIGIAFIAVSSVAVLVGSGIRDSHGTGTDEWQEGVDVQRKAIKYLWVPILFLFVSALVPDKETMYLIAGSEIGEMAVTSEEGKAIIKDIQEVIRAQLGKLKE